MYLSLPLSLFLLLSHLCFPPSLSTAFRARHRTSEAAFPRCRPCDPSTPKLHPRNRRRRRCMHMRHTASNESAAGDESGFSRPRATVPAHSVVCSFHVLHAFLTRGSHPCSLLENRFPAGSSEVQFDTLSLQLPEQPDSRIDDFPAKRRSSKPSALETCFGWALCPFEVLRSSLAPPRWCCKQMHDVC